jgi:CRISPR type IV-associated protein Csf2
MHTYVFEGTMTALTSISHIGESRGVNSNLRRERIVQPNGQVEEVPVISGNALRGILRDRGMLHMLKALGYGVDETTGEVRGLSLAAFYFLFSGGALTKTGSRGLDVDEARRWRDLIPLVALFGGAMGNQIMPGKAKIGKAIPICSETMHIIPENFAVSLQSIWDLCQMEAYTRRDDEKNEGLRQLIVPETRLLLDAEAAARRQKINEAVAETGQKQQMRYYVETLAAGTQLFWDIALEDVTPLEFEAFCVTLAQFGKAPYIGGKSGVGHGKVRIAFDKWIEINPLLAPQGQELAFSLGTLYTNHLEERGDDIRSLINGLS